MISLREWFKHTNKSKREQNVIFLFILATLVLGTYNIYVCYDIFIKPPNEKYIENFLMNLDEAMNLSILTDKEVSQLFLDNLTMRFNIGFTIIGITIGIVVAVVFWLFSCLRDNTVNEQIEQILKNQEEEKERSVRIESKLDILIEQKISFGCPEFIVKSDEKTKKIEYIIIFQKR